MENNTTKKCPHCKTEINASAKKCPNCQSDLRNWFIRHYIITALGAIILIGIIASAASNNNSTNPSSNNSVSQKGSKQLSPEEQAKKDADEKALQQALSKPHFEDGNFVVGTDIQAGTYRTRKASSGCYYSRLSGFGGSLSEIISNENTDAPAIITIAATDKGFKSSRCGLWTQDLSAITRDQTTFGDGIFIIGTDIQAGTYKNSDSDGCYYSRLRGFSGTLGDIISNENTDSSAVVAISSTDKGFKSTRCGTWVKLK